MRRALAAVDRERVNLAAHNLLRRLAHRCRLDVVRADFNSPILATRPLPERFWNTPMEIAGLELGLEAQRQMVVTQLMPMVAELDIPLRCDDPTALHLHNPWYGPMDAQTLYAMLRNANAKKVLELGSGFSSLVIDRALRANHSGSEPGGPAHIIVDPFPSPTLRHLNGRADVRRESAAAVERALFEALEAGDVLFVDTSHVVRPGGEVVRLVLEILPCLRPGVLIHFHDIYVPFPYPRVLHERYNVHWQEQYLLAAMLAQNPRFAVTLSNHALWRADPEWAKAMFTGLENEMQPSAFWFVRTNHSG